MCTEGGRSYYLIFFVRDLYVIMFHHDIESNRCCLVNHVIIGCVLNHANFSTTHPPMIATRAMIFARLMVSLK